MRHQSSLLFNSWEQTAITLAVLGLMVIALASLAHAAVYHYTSRYPTVGQLQAALNARPGAQIPAKEVAANGRYWTAWYVGAHAIGGGRYSVIIELR